ncbi:Oidioi.mRNA.OKI2018_I69.XSR.g16559.t1.cds [Oikopleura dioica]|uniref:Oidioi.mRNA.OKI2018_I69.XSR.g16559.t1.cds n=1 Tax=Oikopleura dioica TaxID=34765 RepID=A0ABN7SLC1_OIKDI|nr:Oidioi.mRNA.OKI2018_I69.XSR.g16559.t1.cds [Oikopleura dioica]
MSTSPPVAKKLKMTLQASKEDSGPSSRTRSKTKSLEKPDKSIWGRHREILLEEAPIKEEVVREPMDRPMELVMDVSSVEKKAPHPDARNNNFDLDEFDDRNNTQRECPVVRF